MYIYVVQNATNLAKSRVRRGMMEEVLLTTAFLILVFNILAITSIFKDHSSDMLISMLIISGVSVVVSFVVTIHELWRAI